MRFATGAAIVLGAGLVALSLQLLAWKRGERFELGGLLLVTLATAWLAQESFPLVRTLALAAAAVLSVVVAMRMDRATLRAPASWLSAIAIIAVAALQLMPGRSATIRQVMLGLVVATAGAAIAVMLRSALTPVRRHRPD